jgi:hypothetical protein
MEDVTTFLSLTTGVFPIACKTESRIGLLCAMIFSTRPPQLTLLELDVNWPEGIRARSGGGPFFPSVSAVPADS